MEEKLEILSDGRKEVLTFYSPYTFIREIDLQDQYLHFVRNKVLRYSKVDSCHQLVITIDDMDYIFLYEFLIWDSGYFRRSCYKLFTILFSRQDSRALVKAILIFKEKLKENGSVFCLIEVPAEDIFLIQCLNEAGIRLVETRLHFFKSILNDVPEERYSVREASVADIPLLSQVAELNRNNFDRLHADYAFSEKEADGYLRVYAEAAVNGFCDKVFVPNEEHLPVASFLAFNHLEKIDTTFSIGVLKVSLAAVAAENKGWLFKLLSEVVHYGKSQKASYVEYPTQSTNRAAIRTCEKLGFNLGPTSHILTFRY